MTPTKKIRIGLIKEAKEPADKRVPLTPSQAKIVMQTYEKVEVVAERSESRAFTDADYEAEGIKLVNSSDLKQCDLLMGVKEVPVDRLIAGKDYMFFSHTIKKQPYNKKLFEAILEKKIRLIDYETMVDKSGTRLIGFGRFAGLVGAYNGLLTWGKRFGEFALPRAKDIDDLKQIMREARAIEYPAIKILVTGAGRVGNGAVEMLKAAGIRQVDIAHFLHTEPEDQAFFSVIDVEEYNKRKDGEAFDKAHFFANPEMYESNFERFTQTTDLLIASAYWDPKAPKLFSKEQTRDKAFRIKVIADITCDIDGSIPSTVRACTLAEPFYDFDPKSGEEKPAFSSEKHLSVMAIDTLPGELPKNASESFGDVLMRGILPYYFEDANHEVIERAAITDKKGGIMPRFSYLADWK